MKGYTVLYRAIAVSALLTVGCTNVGESLFGLDAVGADTASDTSSDGGGDDCVTFERVTEIMTENGCTGCHGTNAGLSVATVADMLTGGVSGPAIEKFNPDDSLLICRIEGTDCGAQMPFGGQVPASQIAELRQWISEGMEDPATCEAGPSGPTFDDISPIFQANCSGCHIGAALGGLDLSSEAGLKAGGNSGAAFVTCDSSSSLIIHRMDGTQPPLMPQGGPALPDSEIAEIAAYIDGGAGDPSACSSGESCTDGIENQNEEGVDCGGVCPTVCGCDDGEKNNDETGVDCGGSCDACPPGLIDYDTDIAPIWLAKGCAEAGSCHGQPAASAPRGFNFTIENMVALPGETDAPVHAPLVVPCDADNSLLYKVLVGPTGDPDPALLQMPQTGDYLDATELGLVKDWIDQGASPVVNPTLCQ